jgi:hypothetical protein
MVLQMKQAIAGVAPRDLEEVTIMTVWPTIAATRAGQLIGRACLWQAGVGSFFTMGKLMALLCIPLALALFAWGLMPGVCRRYRLTNRRVIVAKGLRAVEERSISLADFDAIDVVVLPGQEWYPAGELVFRKGSIETFRLSGVPRPETFRRTCLKARNSYAAIQKVVSRQPAGA